MSSTASNFISAFFPLPPGPRLKLLDPLYIPPGNAGYRQELSISMALPTYEEVVNLDRKKFVWELVAPYLENSSLAACSRVNSEFNEIFGRAIWANPVATIRASGRGICSKLARFLSGADKVRRKTIMLVAILDFRCLSGDCRCGVESSPACGNVGNCDLIYECLHLFTNAKVLFFDRLYNFGSDRYGIMGPIAESTYDNNNAPLFKFSPLMVSLVGSYVSANRLTYSHGSYFMSLIYLDISWTKKYPKMGSMFSPGLFPNLRIFKMQGLNLRDEDVWKILDKIGRRLWSLDLRNNQLTDDFISWFDQFSLPALDSRCQLALDCRYFEDTPVYTAQQVDLGREDAFINGFVPLRPDDATGLGRYLSSRGNLEAMQPLDDEDEILQKTGITQLCISENHLTATGVWQLLQSSLATRLQVLDIGAVQLSAENQNEPVRDGRFTMYSLFSDDREFRQPTFMRLESLRVHHSLVTSVPSAFDPATMVHQLPNILESRIPRTPRVRGMFFDDPRLNSRISNLTLVGIPRRSQGVIIDSLISFLVACAVQEEEIKALKVQHISRRSTKIFSGLRVLQLEFHPDKYPSPGASGPSISVSGDEDADEFIVQSANDFSFFDSPQDQESSRPPRSPVNSRSPAAALASPPTYDSFTTGAVGRDVVEELKAFRKSENSKWTGKLILKYLD